MSVIQKTAKNAKSGIRAFRGALSRKLQGGQARVKDAVDSTGRRADDSLLVIERAAIKALDSIARGGAGYARDAKGRLYAVEGRLFRRRRAPPVGTALVGVGVGLLLTRLFTAPSPKSSPRRRAA